MIGHEGRDEVIAVIVTRLHPQCQRDAGIVTGLPQQLRLELLCEELIGIALIDQDFRHARTIGNQRAGVISAPRTLVGTDITAERLLAPRAMRRRHDRCESRDAAETIGRANTRDDFNHVIILIDVKRVGVIRFEALADYITMIGLAQIEPNADLGGARSIIGLFADRDSGAAVCNPQISKPGSAATIKLNAAAFAGAHPDILRVGLVGTVSTVATNLAIGVTTALVGGFGTAAIAGYGTASRLEADFWQMGLDSEAWSAR
eukprot:gene35867-48236_t